MSGPTKDSAVGVSKGERTAVAADPRIDNCQMDTDRHVRQRVRQHERALQDGLGRDAVGDIDDLGPRGDPLDHAVTRSDEVVLETEVGEKHDEHDPSLRAARSIAGNLSNSLDEPLDIVRDGLTEDVYRAARAARVVSGPIETAGMSVPRAPKSVPPTQRRADTDLPWGAAPVGAHGCGRER